MRFLWRLLMGILDLIGTIFLVFLIILWIGSLGDD